jgi:hypothetical protein
MSRDDLALELARLDRLLHRLLVRTRARYAATADELCGLYISDQQVDKLIEDRPDDATLTAEIDRDLGRLGAAIEASPGPLRGLARTLGLDDIEADLVLLGAATELHRKYEPLIAYLNNDVSRRWPTVGLALDLFSCGNDPGFLRCRLEPTSPLFRRGILERVPAPERRSSLAECYATAAPISFAIAGLSPRDPTVTAIISADAGGPVAPPHVQLGGVARLSDEERQMLVVLTGERGAGTRASARALFAGLGRGLLAIDGARASQHPDARGLARSLALVATIEPSGAYLDARDVAEPAILRGLVDELVREAPGPVVLALRPETSWRGVAGTHPVLSVACGPPEMRERAALWTRHLGERNASVPAGVIPFLAERFPLGRGDIRLAAREAVIAHRAQDGTRTLDAGELVAASQARLDRELGQLATKLVLPWGWSDLVLPGDTTARLREVASAIQHHGLVLGHWGFRQRIGSPALAAMFCGASGTGKTMTAAVIANAVGLELYRIDLSAVVSKYIGETEKNLDRIFRIAHRSNAILFFDEADALFGKRSEVKDAHDRYANLEISYLLQRLDNHDGIVLLASNLARNIDRAFSRRMSFVIDFPRPDAASRARLWRGMFPRSAPLDRDADLDFLAASFELTGGEIRTVALDAAYAAAGNGRTITMRHLVRATARQLYKQGTAPALSQFKQYYALLGPEERGAAAS